MDQSRIDAPRRNDVTQKEWEARVDLAAAYRMAAINRWTDLIFNHFTVRVPDEPDHFLIKRHTLFFEEVTASNLVKVNLTGEPVGIDQDVNLAGFIIHSAVYKVRPDVNAIMHLHSQAGTAVSAKKCGLRFLCQEAMLFYNRIGYHDFEGIALDEGECERLGRDLGRHNTMILRNHGLLTCSDTVADAMLNLRTLIQVAEMQLQVEAGGSEVNEPPAEICERTARQFEALHAKSGRRDEWQGVLRWLDRADPSYRN